MTEEIVDYDDLAPKVYRFKHKGEEYELREASEAAAMAHQTTIMSSVKAIGANGKPSQISGAGIAEADSVLVAECVYNSAGNKVGMTTIRSWPRRIIKDLYEKAKKNSHIDEGKSEGALKKAVDEAQQKLAEHQAANGEDPAKNALSGTTDTLD